MKNYKEELLEYMNQIKIIDSHEHFQTESMHMNNFYSFYNWFMPYIQYDLVSAGMNPEHLWNPPSNEEEAKKYWEEIRPLWKYVKHGSYAKPFLMALRKFYGYDDLTDQNYEEIGKKMNETKKEGFYDSIIKDKCNIEYMLNQINQTHFDENDYMKGAYSVVGSILHPFIIDFIEKNKEASLDDYTESIKNAMKKAKNEGAILCKYDATCFLRRPNYDKAKEQFDNMKKDKNFGQYDEILIYVSDETLKYIYKLDMVACVHTGVWGNINVKSPEHLFAPVELHPQVTFDIYHMGMPYVRECGFLGKNYSNANLNLCWSYIVSEEMTKSALNEWIDIMPLSKIIGFGADYSTNPENIWAHLEMAKDVISKVLSTRIKKGKLDLDEAKWISKLWLYDNPKRIYKL